MNAYGLIILCAMIVTVSSCGTPKECYQKAIEIVKNDRQIISETRKAVNEKISEVSRQIKEKLAALHKDKDERIIKLDNEVSQWESRLYNQGIVNRDTEAKTNNQIGAYRGVLNAKINEMSLVEPKILMFGHRIKLISAKPVSVLSIEMEESAKDAALLLAEIMLD